MSGAQPTQFVIAAIFYGLMILLSIITGVLNATICIRFHLSSPHRQLRDVFVSLYVLLTICGSGFSILAATVGPTFLQDNKVTMTGALSSLIQSSFSLTVALYLYGIFFTALVILIIFTYCFIIFEIYQSPVASLILSRNGYIGAVLITAIGCPISANLIMCYVHYEPGPGYSLVIEQTDGSIATIFIMAFALNFLIGVSFITIITLSICRAHCWIRAKVVRKHSLRRFLTNFVVFIPIVVLLFVPATTITYGGRVGVISQWNGSLSLGALAAYGPIQNVALFAQTRGLVHYVRQKLPCKWLRGGPPRKKKTIAARHVNKNTIAITPLPKARI